MIAIACAGLLGYKLWTRRDSESGLLQKIERVNQKIKACCSSPLALHAVPMAVSLLQLALAYACAEKKRRLSNLVCLLLQYMLGPTQVARRDAAKKILHR